MAGRGRWECVVVSALLFHIEMRGRQTRPIVSDLESRRGRARARLRNGASVLDGTPTSKGVDGEGGHATTSPECEYRSTGSGHEFIYAIPPCTDSRCPPTERQESNTSIYQQSFATIGL